MEIIFFENFLYLIIEKKYVVCINYQDGYICTTNYEHVDAIKKTYKQIDMYELLFNKEKFKKLNEILNNTIDIRQHCKKCPQCRTKTCVEGIGLIANYKKVNKSIKELKELIQNIREID